MNDECEASLGRKVKPATPFHNSIGTSDFAKWDEDGELIEEPKFPFEVVLEPYDDVYDDAAEWFEE